MTKTTSFIRSKLLITAGVLTFSYAAPGTTQSRQFDVPAQPAAQAVSALARQADIQILLPGRTARGVRSNPVVGQMSIDEALSVMLARTGLEAKKTGPQTWTVTSLETPGELEAGSAAAVYESAEIIVTAQKRDERLQDVPIPMSVVAPNVLIRNNFTNLRDYFTSVPGISLASSAGGAPVVIIRGVTTGGFINPVTGVTVDDAPYGATTAMGGGFAVIDLDPSDLARIEVLRGPQGTLYGASSMGGLLKYVTADPTTDELSGRVTAGAQTVKNGDGMGHSLRGALNVPMGERFAIRASAFTRHDAGFINAPARNARGVNVGNSYGGRLSALWRASDDVTVKLSVLHQNLKNAADEVDLASTANDLELTAYIPGYFGAKRKVTFLTATINAKLGAADLTSISAYTRSRADQRNAGVTLGGFATSFGGNTGPYQALDTVEKYSQEVRATIPLSSHIDWLIGGFYTREDSVNIQRVTAGSLLTGNLIGTVGNILDAHTPSTYEELAAFTDVTVHFSESFDVQLGARQGYNWQERFISSTGTIGGGSIPTITRVPNAKDNAFTYLFTPRLKLSSNKMVYFRLATGYRPGGAQTTLAVIPGAPKTIKADTTTNYEMGFKGDIIDNALSIDASVYQIDWKDIPVQLADRPTSAGGTGLLFNANAGDAKIQGAEVSIEARPVTGLRIAGWGTYTDAKMKSLAANSPFPGKPGDRLPFSSRFSGNISVDYEFPISDLMTVQIGGAVSRVGHRMDTFVAAPGVRLELPGYTQIDLHGGFRSDGWDVNLFANNITDRRGVVARGGQARTQTIVRPRTIGISIGREF